MQDRTKEPCDQRGAYPRIYVLPAAAFGAGLALAVTGWVRTPDAGEPSLLVVGLTLVLLASLMASALYVRDVLAARMRPFDELFAEGLEMGHNRGYREGRRDARPTVVPMRCPDCGHRFGRDEQTG